MPLANTSETEAFNAASVSTLPCVVVAKLIVKVWF